MTIISWEYLYDYRASTVANTNTDADLYEKDWQAIRLNVDRVMSKFEIEQTPEWASILNAMEEHTIIYQSPFNTERLYKMAITAVTPDLISRLKGILNQLGLDVKGLKEMDALLQQNQGNLTALTTTDKSNLVAAINEVKAQLGNIDLTSLINDETASTATVFSSTEVLARIQIALDGVVNGAPGTLDTLSEIADAINANSDVITTINAALNGAVRFDVVQNRSTEEKAQARANIDGASEADLTQLAANIGNIATLDLTDYTNPRDGVAP